MFCAFANTETIDEPSFRLDLSPAGSDEEEINALKDSLENVGIIFEEGPPTYLNIFFFNYVFYSITYPSILYHYLFLRYIMRTWIKFINLEF
jgi:hypothetical protein